MAQQGFARRSLGSQDFADMAKGPLASEFTPHRETSEDGDDDEGDPFYGLVNKGEGMVDLIQIPPPL